MTCKTPAHLPPPIVYPGRTAIAVRPGWRRGHFNSEYRIFGFHMEQTAHLTVGVVIRTFHSEAYLEESLQSVLNQTYKVSELVIIDGGSTDETLNIIRRVAPEARVLRQSRPGIGGMARQGIEALSTDLIAFQDSDDIWPKQRLEVMINALRSNPGWDAVMGGVEHFLKKRYQIPEGLKPGVGLPSFLAHRRAFEKAGAFHDGLMAGEYMEWQSRAMKKGVIIGSLSNVTLKRRVHTRNHSQSSVARSHMMQALKLIISRRRGDETSENLSALDRL